MVIKPCLSQGTSKQMVINLCLSQEFRKMAIKFPNFSLWHNKGMFRGPPSQHTYTQSSPSRWSKWPYWDHTQPQICSHTPNSKALLYLGWGYLPRNPACLNIAKSKCS